MPLYEQVQCAEEQALAMFDSFVTRVLRNARLYMNRRRLRYKGYEIKNSYEYGNAATDDRYPSAKIIVRAGGLSCAVESEMLAEALNNLPEKRRGAIILNLWHHYNDQQIADHYHIVPRTVRQWRQKSYMAMRQFFKEQQNENVSRHHSRGEVRRPDCYQANPCPI